MESNGIVKELTDGRPGERQTTCTITNNECSTILHLIDYYQNHFSDPNEYDFKNSSDLKVQIEEIKHIINAGK